MAAGTVECRDGSLDVQADTGVAFPRKTVQLTGRGNLDSCSSAQHPKLSGGTITLETALQARCPGPFGPGYAKVTIAWNDGSTTSIDQSTFRGDSVSFALEGGRVTSGVFTGGTVRADGRTTTPLIEMGAACATGGLTAYSTTINQVHLGDL
ncbi:hypothetical protein [Spirillospora sp. NPDC047279]|uniref:hypothetical protein n=1 Tax=Spirillospora sp. NPDC047279 TaxID=3155478 RepID=UPI0034093BE9